MEKNKNINCSLSPIDTSQFIVHTFLSFFNNFQLDRYYYFVFSVSMYDDAGRSPFPLLLFRPRRLLSRTFCRWLHTASKFDSFCGRECWYSRDYSTFAKLLSNNNKCTKSIECLFSSSQAVFTPPPTLRDSMRHGLNFLCKLHNNI